jgi:hypothetical protein
MLKDEYGERIGKKKSLDSFSQKIVKDRYFTKPFNFISKNTKLVAQKYFLAHPRQKKFC